MSTVALKGKLQLIEIVTAKTATSTDTQKIRKWHWKGKWAFGSHIDAACANKNITTSLPKRAHKLQPFHYYFEEIADPAKVVVPSRALFQSLPTDPNTAGVDTLSKNTDGDSVGVTNHSTLSIEESPNKCFEQSRELPASTNSAYKAEPTSGDVGIPVGGGPLCTAEKCITEAENTCDEPDSVANKTGIVPKSLALSMEAALMTQRCLQVQPKSEKTANNYSEAKSKRHDDNRQSSPQKNRTGDDDNSSASSDSYNLNGCLPDTKTNEADETKLQVTASEYSATPKQLDPSLSFAAVASGDPPFTEALSFFSHNNDNNLNREDAKKLVKSSVDDGQNPCPSSGLWKGYFQNASVGRGKGTQRVQEQFYLFLNARPGANAEFSFDGVQNQMPPPHVQDPILVRGSGENQFGIFEFCGYLDISTMEMEIQRQYVHVEEETTMTKPSPNKKKRQRVTTTVVTRHKSTRPYFTRKRQPSWKIKSQEESGEDESHKPKKRKMNVETPDGKVEGFSEGGGTTLSSMASAGSMGSEPDPILLSTGSPINRAGTTKTQIKRKSSNPVGSVRRRGSSAGILKASSKHTHLAGGSNTMKLPPTGDAQKAKWRAAHFLYYQRHDPEEQQSQQQQHPSTGSSSTITSTNPKYVIYEGEMVDSKREGRGICLYSNNMLYEGGWKRNLEHGYGKVMTSDRTRIIYEGEFERGRMQGKGTYYYEQAENSRCTEGGARYIGEFKENMRNGIGKHYLPDNSVYDGTWSNGLMNGRGVFTWPDNSFYDGEWKDGKRSGQGILKTSDGFYFDGMWVNNTMEGRGFAVYPSGQRYEGLFSRGRREGRGTLTLTNGVVYEGRFREDAVDGQGTMKMSRATRVPTKEGKDNFMIPISFQSDMSHIHTKAGFTSVGD